MEKLKNVAGLQHVGLPTAKMNETIEWYKGLGFEEIYSTVNPCHEPPQKVVFMQLGNLVMEIYAEESTPCIPGAIDHLALDVTADIEGVFGQIKSRGYKLLTPEIQSLPFWQHGIKYFIIEGVNGEKIEFCEIVR